MSTTADDVVGAAVVVVKNRMQPGIFSANSIVEALAAANLLRQSAAVTEWRDRLTRQGCTSSDGTFVHASTERVLAALSLPCPPASPPADVAGLLKIQKQLFRHRPEEGVYGDCHRTAIACLLGMDAKDVPHFMDKTLGIGPAEEAHDRTEEWLNERGFSTINILFSGELSLEEVLQTVKNCNPRNSNISYILGGTSKTGVNHSVVCTADKIVCDPSLDDAGIVGPMDDGHWWITFFGKSSRATLATNGVK